MLRPRLGTPWVGFLRNWRMLWIAQTDSKDSTDSVYYTHIYLTIFPIVIVIVMDNIASLLFGNGLAIGIWISDWDFGIRICLWLFLHALFFIHASLARGYQQTRWYIVRIQATVPQAWVCMSGQLGHKVSTVAATATVLRATCKTFCISSQRYFLWPGNNFSLEFIWCCWVMQRLRQHLNYGDDNAFAYVCDMSAIPCRSCSCICCRGQEQKFAFVATRQTQSQPKATATCHNGHMQQSSWARLN